MREERERERQRLYQALSKQDEGSDGYDKIQDQILKFDRQDNEENKVENQLAVDGSRQYVAEEQAKTEKKRLWIGVGLSITTIIATLFGTYAQRPLNDVPNMLKNIKLR